MLTFESAKRDRIATTPTSRGVSIRESADATRAARDQIRKAIGGGGQRLADSERAFFEPHLGTDLGAVRVHHGANADVASRAIGARALTLGSNVVFAEGEFAPDTQQGRRLLAHELTHVVQQDAGSANHTTAGETVRREPDDKPLKEPSFQLPWTFGDYSLFEERASGIRFLVGVATTEADAIRAVIPAIGKRIAADNDVIKDSASQVKTCFIASTTTRFALWEGKAVLMLDPADAKVDTASHEMGHAIFNALAAQAESKTKVGTRAGNFRMRIADIYARLSHTKEFSEDGETHPAGLWIADPSQWVPQGKKEHPWEDPDEFFASAKEAYQINRKGLRRAIARLSKVDPAVAGPANELLDLLDALFKQGELPPKGVPEKRADAAKTELEGVSGVSKVEETVMSGTLLYWILNPEQRPNP